MSHPERWLSISEAAAYLNVHPATLRRWSDAHEIPCLITPGGHRRFALSDLQRFAEEHRSAGETSALPVIWAKQALTRTRQALLTPESADWLTALDSAMRERHRAIGRRLMGLTLQYVSTEDGAQLLDEAQAIGHDYAELSKLAGISLRDALQAALFFRDKLLETCFELAESAPIQAGDNVRLVKRINALLNVVQLAVAEVYADPPAKRSAQRRHNA
jgi:excisionase family DNA binding protein